MTRISIIATSLLSLIVWSTAPVLSTRNADAAFVPHQVTVSNLRMNPSTPSRTGSEPSGSGTRVLAYPTGVWSGGHQMTLISEDVLRESTRASRTSHVAVTGAGMLDERETIADQLIDSPGVYHVGRQGLESRGWLNGLVHGRLPATALLFGAGLIGLVGLGAGTRTLEQAET